MQNINISTPNDGLGDVLRTAWSIQNTNNTEFNAGLIYLSGVTAPISTSGLTNNGDGINGPYISAIQAQALTYQIANISGLTATLDAYQVAINAISATTTGNTASINVINGTISTLSSTIINQNNAIAAMQQDILNIYSIITP